ncbi:hypothetical protein CCYA_CCYA18G4536 [Cyanidiococcus yangmingshanensis]|nr:hypothetical protein CCYA_CCYA18G4536 [Cyanidiococcus yangmingshanensis]
MVERSSKEAASALNNVAASESVAGSDSPSATRYTAGNEASSTATNLAEKLERSHSSIKGVLGEFANLLKGFLGLNFLYVSYAFSYAGITRGVIGLVLVSTLTFYGCILLVRVKRNIPSDWRHDNRFPAGHGGESAAFVELGMASEERSWGPPARQVLYGDVGAYAYGRFGEIAVNLSLLLTQFGYCTGYLIFLAQTIHDLTRCACQPAWFLLIPLPILLSLALLRSLRKLAPFSFLANLGIFVGFTAVLGFLLANFQYQPYAPVFWKWPVFFGQMSAALEGIGVVLPVEGSMKNPRRFNLILTATMTLMGAVLLLIGLLGFMKFGKDTRSIILLNMGHSVAVRIVKAVACIGILFTYPLQLVPVVQAIEAWLATKTWFGSSRTEISAPHSLRSRSAPLPTNMEEPVSAESVPVAETTEQFEIKPVDSTDCSSSDRLDGVVQSIDIADAPLSSELIFRESDAKPACNVAISSTTTSNATWNAAAADGAGEIVSRAPNHVNDMPSGNSRIKWTEHARKIGALCRNYFTNERLEVFVRVTLVIGTALAAVIAGHDFGLFQSLVGALGAATLAYTLPALFHLRVFWQRLSGWERALDIGMLVFGVGATITATTTTVVEMVRGTATQVS